MATCTKCGADSYHLNDAGVCASEFNSPRITTQQGRFSSSRLYTVEEIEAKAREFDESHPPVPHSSIRHSWTLYVFVEWLKRQE